MLNAVGLRESCHCRDIECASAPTPDARSCFNVQSHKEMAMYWGGGLLGTILVVVFIVWLVRRI